MKFALILSFAILLDNILGDPKFLYHPVFFIGKIVKSFHSIVFTIGTTSFIFGLVVCITTITATGFFVFLILYLTNCSVILQIYLIYSALAWKDLKDETEPIFSSLLRNEILNARKFLSYVVGRDTRNLNKTEIIRATIETISENSIDGIMSVMFFAALGYMLNQNYGMCLSVWIFKSASTLDSMIGYENFGKFGTASARLDDILNFIPARVGGVIILLTSPLKLKRTWKIFLQDRMNHSSPNSAHGESAFAGVLEIRLGGPAIYNNKVKFRKFINVTAREPEIYDILRAWKLLDVSCSLFAIFMMILCTI